MNIEPIDTSTTAGKARVMQLAAEGRRVAYSNAGHHEWALATDPRWDWKTRDYAIIDEPIGPEEVWVEVCDRGFAHTVNASPVSGKGYVAIRYIRAGLAGEVG